MDLSPLLRTLYCVLRNGPVTLVNPTGIGTIASVGTGAILPRVSRIAAAFRAAQKSRERGAKTVAKKPAPPNAHYADNGCNASEQACINAAFRRATGVLGTAGMANSIGKMLTKLGSKCSPSDLLDCISKALQQATFTCVVDNDVYLFSSLDEGPCMQMKTAGQVDPMGPCCGNATNPPADPASFNCSACTDMSATITFTRKWGDLGKGNHPDFPPADPSKITGIESFCAKGNALGGLDCLVGGIIHEAAHSCVGKHQYKNGRFMYVTNGLAHDACKRPDPYEIADAILRAAGAKINPACPFMTKQQHYPKP